MTKWGYAFAGLIGAFAIQCASTSRPIPEGIYRDANGGDDRIVVGRYEMSLFLAIDARTRETVGAMAYQYQVTPDEEIHLTLTSSEAFRGLGWIEFRWNGSEIAMRDRRSGNVRVFAVERKSD
jgi:hypothetical protein